MPDQEEKSPVDQLVDLFVYAPVGLALTALESLPALVEKGRQRVTTQAALAKMIGEFGVQQAGKDLRRRLDDLTELLSDLGVFPGGGAGPAGPAPAPSTNGQAPPAAGAAAPAAPAEPRPDGSARAIPGYDTLSASQVVQRLAGLAPDELEAVRAYEEATRGRRTILSKINQLQSS
jgi:hypothetical protein